MWLHQQRMEMSWRGLRALQAKSTLYKDITCVIPQLEVKMPYFNLPFQKNLPIHRKIVMVGRSWWKNKYLILHNTKKKNNLQYTFRISWCINQHKR